ncbi:MAG: hypothetical protein HYV18_05180 [Gammaproteobacteria bacterium]|nr:hypothetical protein [Gammaproteobacteria bacterium]
MKTRLTLRPGQNGTKKLSQKYGDRLLAVRYRYDAARNIRIKTVELVEEELPWAPTLPSKRNPDEPVFVRIGLSEVQLRETVKSSGGWWHPDRKLWQVPLALAHALGLESRIVA